ncbi:MAG: 3-oxoacyl-[acyl-carrier-protein] synthase III C-terminal domain-containing protein, partial [Thermoplasmata archaeon]
MKEMRNSESVPESHRGIKARYRLLMGKCTKCGKKSFPPKARCVCGCNSFEYKSEIGIAKLYSFTWRNEDGDIVAPADIELAGCIIPAKITDVEPSDLKIGIELEPTFRRLRQSRDGLVDYGLVFRPKITDINFEKIKNDRSSGKTSNRGKIGDRLGIVGLGSFIPAYRIKIEEVARTLGANAEGIKKGNGVEEKAVPNYDQDTITMGVDASYRALIHAGLGLDGKQISSIYFGSTSRPYLIKAGAITIAEAIGATPNVRVQDIDGSFACAANAFYDALTYTSLECEKKANKAVAEDGGLGLRENVLVVGADFPRVPESDTLNQTSGAGAAAFVFGREDVIAEVVSHAVYTTDTPDGWRLPEGELVSQGRFALEPAYFLHVTESIKGALKRANLEGKDIGHVAIYNPVTSNCMRIAKTFGFSENAMLPTRLNAKIGNCGSASVLLSLAYALERAQPNEYVLMTSYGLGAQSE